jgi:hypothetical protein
MTPRATKDDSDAVTEAEVKLMVAKGIEDYDDRVSKPRHKENLDRLDKILDKISSVESWKNGWDAVLRDRGDREKKDQVKATAKRDWLVPILAAIIGALVTAAVALVVDHKLSSALHLAGDQAVHAQVISNSGKSY